MGAAREPDQADFDLERFIDLFDEAMTSRDPRVVETLRSLLMIVALTRPETREPSIDRNRGPLRRLYEDVGDLNRAVSRMQDEIRSVSNEVRRASQPYHWEPPDTYTMAGAAKMAQQIDHDMLNQLRQQQVQAAKVINAGITLGPENAKGKLFK